MTLAELHRLKDGDSVYWDNDEQPGVVRKIRKMPVFIEWPDGQTTYDYDDWALEHVNVR